LQTAELESRLAESEKTSGDASGKLSAFETELQQANQQLQQEKTKNETLENKVCIERPSALGFLTCVACLQVVEANKQVVEAKSSACVVL